LAALRRSFGEGDASIGSEKAPIAENDLPAFCGSLPKQGPDMMNATSLLLCCALATSGQQPSKNDAGHPPSWHEIKYLNRWCGARCLWIAAHSLGKDVDLDHAQLLCDPQGTSEGILSLAQLEEAARKIGLGAKSVNADQAWLQSNRDFPLITLHNVKTVRRVPEHAIDMHYVTVVGVEENRVRYIEPFEPLRERESELAAFSQSWTGYAVLLAPSESDLPSTLDTRWLRALLFEVVLLTGVAGFVAIRSIAFRGRFALFLLLALAGIAGCQENANTPLAAFPELTFNHGVVIEGRDPLQVKHAFAFENAGSRPIIVKSARPACSCTVADFRPEQIPPHRKGAINVELDLRNRRGEFATGVTVVASDGLRSQEIELTVAAYVLPQISVTPETAGFGEVVAGCPAHRDLIVAIPLYPQEHQQKDLRIIGGRSALNWKVLGQTEEIDPSPALVAGEHFRRKLFTVRVSWNPANPGDVLRDQLSLRLEGQTESAHLPVTGTAVHPTFRIYPSTLDFGPMKDSPVRRSLTIQSAPEVTEVNFLRLAESKQVHLVAVSRAKNRQYVVSFEASLGKDSILDDTIHLKVPDKHYPELPIRVFGYRVN
jgi:hypothetical protein